MGHRARSAPVYVAGSVMPRFTLAVLALCSLAVPAGAQDIDGFQPEKGHGDIALSVSFDSYDHFYVGTNKVVAPPLGTVDTNSISLWWRQGLTDRITILASVPYVDVDGDGTANFSDSGIQDIWALAQFGLWKAGSGSLRHSFSVAVGARSPVEDYVADAPVSLGDGTTDFVARATYLLQGRGFYLSQEIGYDARGGDAPDGSPFVTTVGWTFGRFNPSVVYQFYRADGGTDIGDPGFTFPSNKEEFDRIGAKLYTRLHGGWGVSVAAFTTLDGRNTGDTTGYSLGVVRSY